VRIDVKRTVLGLMVAGVAGGLLFLPAISLIGSLLAPTRPALPTTHLPKLVGDALWAEFDGGRGNELQPINPFTLGRMMSCHALAERFNDHDQNQAEHEECMKLLPAVEAINEVSMSHLRDLGVDNSPRVPFVGFATMMNVASKWSRTELLDAIGERGEWSYGFHGVEQAARGFFNRSASELELPHAALLAALHRDRHLDPWCFPAHTADDRRRTLQRMRDNGAIDETELQAANVAPLGLANAPADHAPCSR
jgi:hypothetical protein